LGKQRFNKKYETGDQTAVQRENGDRGGMLLEKTGGINHPLEFCANQERIPRESQGRITEKRGDSLAEIKKKSYKGGKRYKAGS